MKTKTTPNNSTKVLPLLRVSSKDQTFPRQVATIEYIVDSGCAKGLEALAPLELKVSGAYVQDSPDFQLMLGRLSDPSIAGVVVSSLDRFFRPASLKAYYVTLTPFIDSGKVLYTKDGIIDPSTDEGMAIIFAKGQQANNERKAIVERTTEAKNIYRTLANRKSDPIPTGVAFDRATGVFSYTPESDRVKEAFHRFTVKGQNLYTIALALGFKSQSCLRSVLKNGWWIGCKVSHVVDGVKLDTPRLTETNLAKTPLVTRKMFDAAQEILAANFDTFTKKSSHTEKYLGHGLLMCECGQPMYLVPNHDGVYTYYKCASRHRAKKGQVRCELPCHRIDFAEKRIMDTAVSTFTDVDFVESEVEKVADIKHGEEIARDIEREQKLIASIEGKKRKQMMLAEAAEDSDISMYGTRIKELNVQQTEAKNRVRQLQSKTTPAIDPKKIAQGLRLKFWGFHTWELAQQKATLQEHVERVIIDGTGNARFFLKLGITTFYPAVSPVGSRQVMTNVNLETPACVRFEVYVAACGAN